MNLTPFALERYFAQYEFTARYLLSSSDCESLGLQELLEMADEQGRQLWQELRLGYTETPGHPLLRAEIARLHPGLHPEEVVVAAPEELIYLYMHTVLISGDRVVCVEPAYQSLQEVARALGCEVLPWRLRESEGAWCFDLEELKELLSTGTRLLVINFPHNPSGTMISKALLREIVQLVEQTGTLLFSDEMYRFLERPPFETLPAAATLSRKAFSLGGLSKSFGLPGLRLGWLVGADPGIREGILSLKDYTTICNSAPSEILGWIALKQREAIVASRLRLLQRNLNLFQAFLERHRKELRANLPQGGPVCLARLEREGSAEAFCRQLVASTGIMLVPSTLFSFGDRHLRIGFGRENFPQALDQLSAYWSSQES